MVAGAAAISLIASRAYADAPADQAPAPKPVPADIEEYVVDGNTVLSEVQIERAVYPFLGPDRTTEDIENARAALEAQYRKLGYQTVAVATSGVGSADGVVHLQVVEEAVGRLDVTGAKYHSPADIKGEAPSLAEGKVPNFIQVQQDVTNLNQLPGRTVTPVLKAGKDPGTVDVDLQVDDTLPLHASLDLDNRQSQGTTPLRLNAAFSYDNLWQLGHSIGLTFITAPENPSDATVFIGSYTARFQDSPLSLQLTGIVSNSNVITVGSTDVLGNGQIVAMRGILALPGSTNYVQTAFGEVDYKHFLDNTKVAGVASLTPVTYFPFTFGYGGTLTEGSAVDQANASLTFAAPELGSGTSEFDNKRYNARGQDFYLKADFDRVQQLPLGAEADIRFGGQITDQPLISNEQYAVGGIGTVRGYLEAEELGDYGFVGGIELRTPSLIPLLGSPGITGVINQARLIAFGEGGTVYLHEPLPGQRSVYSLASVGVGARLKLFDHLNGALDLAIPLITTDYTTAYSERLLFRVWTEL